MREIAQRSGIPRATLYYYFSGKQELVAFLLGAMLDDLRESVEAALDTPGDVEFRLRAVIRAQFSHLAANPASSRLLLVNLGNLERLHTLRDGLDEAFHTPVRRLLEEALGAGSPARLDPHVAATAIYGAVTILGLAGLLHGAVLDVDALTEQTFALFWSGLSRSDT